jgi:hypothetical protein
VLQLKHLKLEEVVAQAERFSFWFPLAATLALAAIPAALWVGVRHYSRVINDPAVEQRECVVAVEIARETLRGQKALRSTLERQGLPVLELGFDPILSGLSNEGFENASPKFVPSSVKMFVLVTDRVDCARNFSQARIPILRDLSSYSDRPSRSRIHFSRIVFSRDGQRAFAMRNSTCGNLCGSGWETVWHLHAGRWSLEKSKQVWIS